MHLKWSILQWYNIWNNGKCNYIILEPLDKISLSIFYSTQTIVPCMLAHHFCGRESWNYLGIFFFSLYLIFFNFYLWVVFLSHFISFTCSYIYKSLSSSIFHTHLHYPFPLPTHLFEHYLVRTCIPFWIKIFNSSFTLL